MIEETKPPAPRAGQSSPLPCCRRCCVAWDDVFAAATSDGHGAGLGERKQDVVAKAIQRLTARNAELAAALREAVQRGPGNELPDALARARWCELLGRIDAEAAAKPMADSNGPRLFCGIDWSKDALAAAEANGRREAFAEALTLIRDIWKASDLRDVIAALSEKAAGK